VKLLLDTHVVIWWPTDDGTLSDEIMTMIDDEPEMYVATVGPGLTCRTG